ncbi:ABC transporter permease [Cuneatibacter sp. NSJ-177]|uniref:ABC transporter permease n=1 Tax=Cuneatibacter sp. NSJ-177 TaxID=2931401 RepID=UPI001FD11EA6|nr:ABC transporter permease [Cuneatibacter sp. NSJ-177]MCJ7835405.1 ABC transporter permease [Cuneatibacter sp. NSJ-177]
MKKRLCWNQRTKTLILLAVAVFYLAGVAVWGLVGRESALVTDFSRKNLTPSLSYLFGTDWLGRDMLARTVTGLSISIIIGVCAAAVSAVIAGLLGVAAATLGKKVDAVITWLIDLIMGIPHILLLILISFAAGKGLTGVILGVSLTHWTSLARVIRAEVLQLKESTYIRTAEKLGHSKWRIAKKHMLPHLIPQFLVGLVLLFPHAILHEASITFLGFGLSTEQPAIGVILSESMKYLVTGKWWLALFPGLMLVLTVMLFDLLGECLRKLTDPGSVHR